MYLQKYAAASGRGRMVEADMLLRYIRIFSELSGQLKYAAQKRVLLEVALIKLCTPAMETSSDSILDRIRVLEEKLEQGVISGGQERVVYVRKMVRHRRSQRRDRNFQTQYRKMCSR